MVNERSLRFQSGNRLPPTFRPPPKFTPPPPRFVAPPPRFVPPPPRFVPPPPTFRPIGSADAIERRAAAVPPPNFRPAGISSNPDTAERQLAARAAAAANNTPPPLFRSSPPSYPSSNSNPSSANVSTSATTTSSSTVQTPPPAPTPPPPRFLPPPAIAPKIKAAPIDTVLFNDDAVPKELVAKLLFEDIAGQELLTISRHDTVNGQDVSYSVIDNLKDIQREYNPKNIAKIRGTSEETFNNFAIDLSKKIPSNVSSQTGSNIYLNSTGDIIIELINVASDERVEIEITSSGTIEEIG